MTQLQIKKLIGGVLVLAPFMIGFFYNLPLRMALWLNEMQFISTRWLIFWCICCFLVIGSTLLAYDPKDTRDQRLFKVLVPAPLIVLAYYYLNFVAQFASY